MFRITRRRFLELAGASGATLAPVSFVPGCSDADLDTAAPPAKFFTPEERQVIEEVASAIIPEDATVGAFGADAVELIDRFLAAFDNERPLIYGGGPFSGRQAYPDPATGMPSDEFPPNAFLEFLPLTRMQELSLRVQLYGSSSVPNGDINAGVPGATTTPGLRAIYRDGVASLLTAAGVASAEEFAALADADQLAALGRTPSEFQRALRENLAEGMFSAPEYGGNRDLRGWIDYHWDGDSQPLGYTYFGTDGLPYDRPDRPNQVEDPNRPARPFSPGVESFVNTITLAQGGKRFF
ncbi:MAG: gluconate 2-dehydrogenase subunit 3 family protein [Deltaproteobacteria bacterium]|nr:gluconate 2-dehydrogenase subunit 3 family protein [Deltaproteobacteria bacterium]